MLQLEPGLPAGLRGEAHLDPADLAGELPGRGEAVRRIAALDGAARVAFQLIAAAQPQVTGDRQEPSWDPFRVGAGVPGVVEGAVIGLADGHDSRFTRLQDSAADF